MAEALSVFSEAELASIMTVVERIQTDAVYRTLVSLEPARAMRDIGLTFPDRAEVRKSLADAGMSAEDLARFDGATPEQVAHEILQSPAPSGDLGVGEVASRFYRGVPGFNPAAHWWGFHIPFAYADVNDLFSLGQAINSLLGTFGMFVAKAVPPIKPFIAALLVYLVVQIAVIYGVGKGCERDRNAKGAWVSMAWIAPGAFVPTCVY